LTGDKALARAKQIKEEMRLMSQSMAGSAFGKSTVMLESCSESMDLTQEDIDNLPKRERLW